jgi:hypothetical protein
MEVAMSPSRFPILTFTLIGLLFVLANEALIRALMSLAARSHQNVASILAEVVNWIEPGLWLLVISLCLLLTNGTARTPGSWPQAIAVLYFSHIPLMAFPPPPIFGRWGFVVYLFIGSVGVVCAIWLLTKSFHIAAFFLLAEPAMRNVSWGQVHHGTRSITMVVFSLIGWALIGWWFQETVVAGTRSESSCR